MRRAAVLAVRAPPSAIRAAILDAVDAAGERGVDGLGTTPVTRGANVLRRGRWFLCDTSTAGVLIAVELAEDLTGLAVYIGQASALRSAVPRAIRLAWLAGTRGEADDDPDPAP